MPIADTLRQMLSRFRLKQEAGHGRSARLLLAAGLCAVTAVLHAAPQDLPLIPMPAQLERGSGAGYAVDGRTPILVPADDAVALRTAHYLADAVRRTRGLTLQVRTLRPGEAATGIALVRDPAVTDAEAYALDADARGIRIAAGSDAGLFYGAVTLWQLLTPREGEGAATVPPLRIRDRPRFSWRGVMLDSARHYQTPETIKALLDQMALHKLNTFHWHLSDDQGWRLEIKRYPDLTRIGAWREPPGGQPSRYGGYYSQAQVREIVAYAAERHIEVVPELDMPGHAQAAVAAYPQIGVFGDRPPVAVDWGINPYLFNVEASTFVFIQNVLDEVMALFPSRYIHLGGDEAIKDQWKASPAVQARMRALRLKNEEALQSWFMERLGRYLAEHDRRLIGWDEILDGGLPPSASVMSWRGMQGVVASARHGHDVVLAAPYLDNLQSARGDEPSGRLAILPLASVYTIEPVPAELDEAESAHVLGVQAQLWSEYLTTAWHIEHALYPRVDAVAEVAWSPAAARDWPGFLRRLPAQMARYRHLGVDAADSAFAVDMTLEGGPAAALASGEARISLSNQAAFGALHYTLDGSEPTPASPRYEAPFAVKLPKVLRAAAFAEDGFALSAPRRYPLDAAALRTRDSAALASCPKGAMGLRVPLIPDAQARGPVFNVNLFDTCWTYPQARLDGIGRLDVHAARLARNYGLAHDADKVREHAYVTRYGELSVRLGCGGRLLATVPLPAGTEPKPLPLTVPLPPLTGVHDLCLTFTGPVNGPFYGIDRVELVPAGAGTPGMPQSSEPTP